MHEEFEQEVEETEEFEQEFEQEDQEEEVYDPREDVEENIEEDESEPEEDEWQPDYSFKVMDKEHEFDDFIKPIVTEENYEQVRDLYEKAYGIDFVKTRKTELEGELTGYKEKESQFNAQNQSLGYMGSLLKNKEYHTLFNELKIPEEDLIKYSLERVNYQDLPPEEKQEYDNSMNDKSRLRTLEMQNQQFQSQMANQAVQARMAEVDNYLVSGQIQSIVNDFDDRAGKPGSFKDEVIRRGQLAYYSTGKDISVREAAEEVMKLYGNVPAQAEFVESQPQYNQVPVQPRGSRQKPTIPNVRSGGHSPARKLPTSIEDLKKAAAAFD